MRISGTWLLASFNALNLLNTGMSGVPFVARDSATWHGSIYSYERRPLRRNHKRYHISSSVWRKWTWLTMWRSATVRAAAPWLASSEGFRAAAGWRLRRGRESRVLPRVRRVERRKRYDTTCSVAPKNDIRNHLLLLYDFQRRFSTDLCKWTVGAYLFDRLLQEHWGKLCNWQNSALCFGHTVFFVRTFSVSDKPSGEKQHMISVIISYWSAVCL